MLCRRLFFGRRLGLCRRSSCRLHDSLLDGLFGEDGGAVVQHEAYALGRAGFHAGRHGLAVFPAPVAAQVAAHSNLARLLQFFIVGIVLHLDDGQGGDIHLNGAIGAGVSAHFTGNAELGMHGHCTAFQLFQCSGGADVTAGGIAAFMTAHSGLVAFALDNADA